VVAYEVLLREIFMESGMHRSLIRRSFVAVALGLVLLVPSSSWAAMITWGPATTISGNSDVVTTGALLYAYNMGDTTVAATTVNGVTFAPFAIPNTFPSPQSVVVGDVGLAESPYYLFGYSLFGSGSTPYANLSTAYKTLLDSAAFADAPATITVSLGGLTVGQDYTVQWWTSDASLRYGSLTTASGVSSVTLDPNTTDTDGGLGQYAVGTFTASSTAETFTLTGSPGSSLADYPMISGLQVRTYAPGPTPVPEIDPAGMGSVLALVTGALGLLERRRLKAKLTA
jgi:hypothetical protein